MNPKVKAVANLSKASADKIIESKQDLAALAKATFEMLPEQAARIVDAQNVRIAALEAKVDATNAELSKLKTKAPD